MKLVAQLQLRVDEALRTQLIATVVRFHEATNWLAGEAIASGIVRQYDLHHACYRVLRERFGLSAQMAVRAVAEVAAALKRDPSKRPVFRALGAMPYDGRILSFKADSESVSILTLEGRVTVPFVAGEHHRHLLAAGKRGQSDLVCRKGRWFLYVSVELPEAPQRPAIGTLGVDLGIINLATDSDGTHHSGAAVEVVRLRTARLRDALQTRGTRSAKRHLKRLAGREARFRTNTNHTLAKTLVRKAQDTDRQIALEDLRGIRGRVTVRREARTRLGGWAFDQLRAHIAYKARRVGVPVVIVDPRGTSTTCLACGHRDRKNRRSQAEFVCQQCGDARHADIVGAVNIARRAEVNRPIVADILAGNRNHSDTSLGSVTSLAL